MTHTNTEAVSDEARRIIETYGRETPADDLALVLFETWCKADPTSGPNNHPASYIATFADMARAALSWNRRSASNTGGVEVKALVWEEDEPGWWCAQPTAMIGGFGYEVRITDSGNVRARRGMDGWAAFEGALEQAKAAAQADFNHRILSAISLAAEAEPVAGPCRELRVWANEVLAAHDRRPGDVRAMENAILGLRGAYESASSVSAEVTVTDESVKRATIEFLMHKGEEPMRVTRGGREFWELSADAMRAALAAINGGRENG